MKAAVRPYETRDFPAALALLQRSAGAVAAIERLMPLLDGRRCRCSRGRERRLARGIAAGAPGGGTGWVVAVGPGDEDTLARLVETVETELGDRGVKRSSCWRDAGAALERRGYASAGLDVYERALAGVGSHDSIAISAAG